MPLLDRISFVVDLPRLLETIHIRPGSANAREVERLAAEAQAIARPKVLYKIAFVDERADNYVVLDGHRFTSRILRVNLGEIHRAFAYVATSGLELEAWAHAGDEDLLRRFWAEAINQMAVAEALTVLNRELCELYGIENLSGMNPGSLADWPLAEQRVLFSLLGDVEGSTGVQLKPSLLMVPTKSVSGILFPSSETFASCQLCPRASCPNRRAAYDATLYERRYGAVSYT